MQFSPATRKKLKARLAVGGLSKSGKSMTSLALLRGIVGDEGRIAAVDTEGTLHAYAGKFPGSKQPKGFDVGATTHFSPAVFIDALESAAKAKYDGFLIDSVSPEWEGVGGVLDIVDGSATDVGGKFASGWRKATPEHRKLIRTVLACPMHLIVTLRQDDAYVMTDNKPVRVGTKLIQGKRFEYEFNVVATMDLEHNFRVQHSLVDFLPNGTVIEKPDGLELGRHLRSWLNQGEEEWEAPVFKKSFYIAGREYISAGAEPETLKRVLNMGAALNKATKPGTAKALLAEVGVAKPEDLTEPQAKALLETMTKAVEAAEAAKANANK
jgi:hypothetical protein